MKPRKLREKAEGLAKVDEDVEPSRSGEMDDKLVIIDVHVMKILFDFLTDVHQRETAVIE